MTTLAYAAILVGLLGVLACGYWLATHPQLSEYELRRVELQKYMDELCVEIGECLAPPIRRIANWIEANADTLSQLTALDRDHGKDNEDGTPQARV